MAYIVLGERDSRWQPRKGLEGPFYYAGGRVLYYDPVAGLHYDPTCDFYVYPEEMAIINNQLLDLFKK